jgi:omega-6 fatty acid desaturase (delta-12 desaturase)
MSAPVSSRVPSGAFAWQSAVRDHARADDRRALIQVLNTLIPYVGLWVVMYYSLSVSYLLTLLLTVPAAGLMVRLFIQFHDAGHGSFFSSPKANETWGIITGLLTFTPFHEWRHCHAIHHATAGDLDRRGLGDVVTLTLEEYRALSPFGRLRYRLYRHPLVMFGLGPIFTFLISNRYTHQGASSRDRGSVVMTNLGLAALVVILGLAMGWKNYLMIQIPVLWLAGAAGIWLFYVQHQFEGVYWKRHPEWDYAEAALLGSSYYRLPRILQWFSGNIGIHHIHHLSSRIPNYRLQNCYDATPEFHVAPITLRTSLRSLRFRFYDEANARLIGFREVRAMEPAA